MGGTGFGGDHEELVGAHSSPAVPGNEPCTRKTEGELILHGVGYF